MNSIEITFQPENGEFKIIVPFRWHGEIGEQFAVSSPASNWTGAVVSIDFVEIRPNGIFANGEEIDVDRVSAECFLAKEKVFALAKSKIAEGSIVKLERI